MGHIPMSLPMVGDMGQPVCVISTHASRPRPRQEFLFEHEGNDIKPFQGAEAGVCTRKWLRPDGGAPSNPTVKGLCSCGRRLGSENPPARR